MYIETALFFGVIACVFVVFFIAANKSTNRNV